ncbi:MAG TPA: ABC transporter [Firmicutes bacterium]|nr:ABC transporter [Bacillota bacterium]
MLELKNIVKDYVTGDLVTHALKGLNVTFRKNEFVSILGPSGCGKTTLLNIIGGLDRYTSGDLIIKGKSTKDFTDRDWDTYRNHSVGFVFQSYNLISHLTILGNVELALTISGVSRKERTARAQKALEKVGLGEVSKKLPNQLSGGQMQRVAIARALVNDPEILLADEPTGALDSETSVQIMELLKEVAKNRLVIMVTHNPELAKRYSSRIISMKDGQMVNDTKPFQQNEEDKEKDTYDIPTKKAKMSLATAFALSAKNLISKFKRTALVVVAGSIGIIGISAVLAVSYGVKSYIRNMQDDMLSGNPVEISESSLDLSAMMSASSDMAKLNGLAGSVEDGKVNIQYMVEYLAKQQNNLSTYAVKNEITEDYVDYIHNLPKENYSAMKEEYGIDPKLNIYTGVDFSDPIGKVDQVSLTQVEAMYTSIINETSFAQFSSMIKMFTTTFKAMPNNTDYIEKQYDILNEGGHIATEENEMMIVVSKDTTLTDIFLGQIGYLTQDEFVSIIDKFTDEENHGNDELSPKDFDYETLLNKKFIYYPNNSVYEKRTLTTIPGTQTHFPFAYKGQLENGTSLDNPTEIKITAILRAKENVSYGCLETGFIISPAFQQKMLNDAKDSEIVASLNEQKEAYESLSDTEKASYKYIVPYYYEYCYKDDEKKTGDGSAVSVVNVDTGGTGMFGNILSSMFGDNYSVPNQFETAIRKTAGNSLTNDISIYPLSFDDKDLVTDYLDKWNNKDLSIEINKVDSDGNQITKVIKGENREDINYQDNLEVVISLINTMIEIVTIALICFTSLSLVVSTVMIGIITYVSVIERVKEIGIIRSLGGRKIDVSNLFNVETFLIGTSSGAFGLAVTYLLCLIINIIINNFANVGTLMMLPWNYALIVLGISILLTLISGLIPASAAAHKDPVIALRSND